MTIQEIKKIAKERYDKELTDEQAEVALADIGKNELANVNAVASNCGSSGDRDPDSGVIKSGTIRYFKLVAGSTGFVSRIQIRYQPWVTPTKLAAEAKTWKSGKDICAFAEGSVDIKNDAPEIPDGSDVWIKVDVAGGYDRIGQQRFTYSSSGTDTATYAIGGTTCYSSFDYKGT